MLRPFRRRMRPGSRWSSPAFDTSAINVRIEGKRAGISMQILVIGSGGREHALSWKVAQSPKVTKVWAAPGNAGITDLAECVPISASDIRLLADFAERTQIDLTDRKSTRLNSSHHSI